MYMYVMYVQIKVGGDMCNADRPQQSTAHLGTVRASNFVPNYGGLAKGLV
jgi:hypothetical protein